MSENRTLSFIFMAMLLLLIGCESNENVKDPKEKTQPTIEMPLKPIRNLVHLRKFEQKPTPTPNEYLTETPQSLSTEVNANDKKKSERSNLNKIKRHNNYFEVTAYSNHFKSTGKNPEDKGYGVTASGAKTIEGVTIASDWNVLPKGTRVWIEGVGMRVVQDKGGAIKGNKIDVYFEREEDARQFGRRKNVKVKIFKGD
ncbi:3D domain-containing protein [Paenibacillus chitinolyticus]|uniref:3D domain-containing protein n=1 Tax=Paenibacillus chitinolyticus TaxID=79263 RepID=UPI00366E8468